MSIENTEVIISLFWQQESHYWDCLDLVWALQAGFWEVSEFSGGNTKNNSQLLLAQEQQLENLLYVGMEWNLFSLSKRRVRINLIELYKCSLNQNWMGSSKVLWVQLEVFWIFASKILNLYLSNKMLRMVPSYPKQKASSAEEKQEISSTICPVNLTW